MIINNLTVELDSLKEQGCIDDYKIEQDIPEDPDTPNMRCYDTLDLIFANGSVLKIGTTCSGSLENSGLFCRI